MRTKFNIGDAIIVHEHNVIPSSTKTIIEYIDGNEPSLLVNYKDKHYYVYPHNVTLINPKINNNACKCVIKQTEVSGMCIIYPRLDCELHSKYHHFSKGVTNVQI